MVDSVFTSLNVLPLEKFVIEINKDTSTMLGVNKTPRQLLDSYKCTAPLRKKKEMPLYSMSLNKVQDAAYSIVRAIEFSQLIRAENPLTPTSCFRSQYDHPAYTVSF